MRIRVALIGTLLKEIRLSNNNIKEVDAENFQITLNKAV